MLTEFEYSMSKLARSHTPIEVMVKVPIANVKTKENFSLLNFL